MKEQYINVPINLLGDPNLDGRNRLLIYCYIKSICDSGKTCAASNAYLAQMLHTSVGVVRTELYNLKKLGYIDVAQNEKKRQLQLTVSDGRQSQLTVESIPVDSSVNHSSHVTDTILINNNSSSNPAEPATTTTSDSSLKNEEKITRSSLVRKIQAFQLEYNLIHSAKFCECLLDKLMEEIRITRPDADYSVANNYLDYRFNNAHKNWTIQGANENYNLVDCYQRACEYLSDGYNEAEAEEAAKKAAEENEKREAEYQKKYAASLRI